MRTTKFRGKLLTSDTWVYGYLIGAAEIRVYTTDEWKGEHEDHLVDPATVGQLTELKDRNGKDIYHKDIVSNGINNYTVVWSGSAWKIQRGVVLHYIENELIDLEVIDINTI